MVAGTISSMAFNVITPGPGTFAQSGFTIKMAHTVTINRFIWSIWNRRNIPNSIRTNDTRCTCNRMIHIRSQQVSRTGMVTSNILIDICHDNDLANTCATCYSTSSTVAASTTSFASNYGTYNDNAQACGVNASNPLTTYTIRPDIRFNSATPTTMTWSPVTDLYTDLVLQLRILVLEVVQRFILNQQLLTYILLLLQLQMVVQQLQLLTLRLNQHHHQLQLIMHVHYLMYGTEIAIQ